MPAQRHQQEGRKAWRYEPSFRPSLRPSLPHILARPSTSKSYTTNYVPKLAVATTVGANRVNSTVPSVAPASVNASAHASNVPHTPVLSIPPLQLSKLNNSIGSIVPHVPLTPPAPKISQLPPEARRDAALDHALRYLARYKVSTADLFLYIFSGAKDDSRQKRRSSFLYDGTALETLLDRFQQYAPDRMRDWVSSSSQSLPAIEKTIGKEMDILKKEWKFGVKDVTSSFITDGLDLGRFRTTIEQSAPTLWHLITRCAQTNRAAHENKLKNPNAICTVIITQLARQRSAQAGRFAIRFGIFLWACGCPRTIIDVLTQLGLCPSFPSIHNTLETLSKSALKATIAAISGQGVAWLNGYDNLNASTSIHAAQQYLGSRPKVENFTARTVYIAKNSTKDAMDAAVFDAHSRNAPTVTLGDLRPSLESIARIQHQYAAQIVEILLASGPFLSLTSQRASIIDYRDVRRPTTHEKTIQFPLTVVEIDESTIEGNRENLEEMMQLLEFTPEQASELKIPTSGDQMTCSRIRSSAEEREADRSPYHRGTVWVPIPGGFHVMLNWLRMMLKVYRGSPADNGALARYIDVLDLKRLRNSEPDHFLLERLIREVYYGHVLACWVEVSGFPTLEAFRASKPSHETLRRLAVSIVDKFIGAPSEASFLSDDQDPASTDETFRSACLFNRDAAIYFEMKSATKRGDFGRIEDLLPLLVCGFRGGGCTKYAHEMLHLLQNLKYSWPQPFANMVRDNFFVNTTGRPLGYKEMDKNQEHAIRTYKFLLAARGMHADSSYLSTMGPLRDFLKDLIQSMRLELGVPYSGSRHSSVDVSRDRMRVALTSVENRLFLKSPSETRRMRPHVINTVVVGHGLMAGARLRAFMALHSSGEPGDRQTQMDIEMEDGTVPGFDHIDLFEEAANLLAEMEHEDTN